MENGGKERLQPREKDDKREKGGVGAVQEMRGKTKATLPKEIAERMGEGKERRSRIVQELFKLHKKEWRLESELREELNELLKHIDRGDCIEQFVGTTLEGNGLEYWTKKGREVSVEVDGTIEVRDRAGEPILRV